MLRLTLVFALFLLAGTTSAHAHQSFGFSINLGVPGYFIGPPVVYDPPPVYYSPPPVVYYQPPPVYYGPTVYYGYEDEPRFEHERSYYRGKHGHGHGHRHGHDHDDDD